MSRKLFLYVMLSLGLTALVVACGAPAPAPTPAPAKPAATSAPAAPAATKAPAAPAAQPTAAPAAKLDWPTRAITILIAYPAGGSSDVGARIIAPLLEKELGQPVQVVNKSGAGGQVGWTELAKSKPDGYTIGGINLPHLPAVVVDPTRQAAFKQEDIVPVASQAVDPTQIAVRANGPYKTIQALIDDAKAKPDKIPAGIVGILQDDEIGYLKFTDVTKTSFAPVRFDGAAPTLTALLGGNIEVTFCTMGDNYAQYKAGKVKPLGTFHSERTKFYPDVPTMKELGYGELLAASSRGFALPKGVPDPIVKRWEEALLKVMKMPEHVTKIEDAGQPAVLVGREEFTKWYNQAHKDIADWLPKAIKVK